MRLLALFLLLFSSVPVLAQGPGKPTNFSATAGSGKSVVLKWTAPAGVPVPTGYHIYRISPPDTTFERITSFGQIAATASTFTDSSPGLVAGTPYVYKVTPYIGTSEDTTVLGTDSDPATATPVDSPDHPLNLRASNITSTSITLTWDSVEGADSYILLRDFDDDLEEFDVDGTTYTDSGLTLNTTYVYTVIAVSSTGEESDESAPVSVTTFGDGSGKTAIWGRRFRQIDINADGLLTFNEYRAGHGGRLSWVVIRNRYDSMDTDDVVGVNLAEYAKGFAGKKYKAPSKARQFYMVDQDGDDELTIGEYVLMLPARTSEVKAQKAFDKRDKDDTGTLSPLELKIRNYVNPDNDDEEEEEPELP